MFIKQAYKVLHEPWRYVVGALAIFIAWQFIGAIPLMAALVLKVLDTGEFPTDIPGMAQILGPNLFLLLMLFSFVVGLLGLFLIVRFLHKQSIVSLTTARKRIDWKRIAFCFALWAVISTAFIFVDILLSPDDYVYNFNPGPFLILLVIAVLLIPIQTSFEEYFMRAYLMQGIGVMSGKKWVPLLFTSLIFGGLHILNPEVEKLGYGIMIFYIGTGFFLGILTLLDDGIELALGFHAANNLTAALLVTADWTAFQTDSIFRDVSEPGLGWDVLLPVLVIYPAMLYFLGRKYGWKNWREQLLGDVIRPLESSNLVEDEDYSS